MTALRQASPARNDLAIVLGLLLPLLLGHSASTTSGYVAGVTHPVLGLDHLLAMISVGILSAQMGGKAIFFVPAVFVTTMAVGAVIGMFELTLPSVETGIALSVVALGAAIASARRMPYMPRTAPAL